MAAVRAPAPEHAQSAISNSDPDLRRTNARDLKAEALGLAFCPPAMHAGSVSNNFVSPCIIWQTPRFPYSSVQESHLCSGYPSDSDRDRSGHAASKYRASRPCRKPAALLWENYPSLGHAAWQPAWQHRTTVLQVSELPQVPLLWGYERNQS
jgi:hypothetical protein